MRINSRGGWRWLTPLRAHPVVFIFPPLSLPANLASSSQPGDRLLNLLQQQLQFPRVSIHCQSFHSPPSARDQRAA